MTKPLIVVDPQPRGLNEIFDAHLWDRLQRLGDLVVHEGSGRMPAERFDSCLPEMELLIGQSDMPKTRLDRAPKLRGIVNVETNFLQNVDYETCFQRGVHVLAPGSAFAKPVAEMTLGLAIDLCRGITAADRAVRAGREKWLLDGAEGCFSLYGARVGLIGFGDLARAFTPLLDPFGCRVSAYDPWVSDHFMAAYGVASTALEDLLRTSQVIIVFAAVTSENQGFLGKREFELITPGSVVLLMSRAGVVDFPEFLRQIESGRFRAATDVFPVEPAPIDDPARRVEGLVLSPHRAGAMTELASRDRAADGRRRRTDPQGPAAAFLQARPARNRVARTLEADRGELTYREPESSQAARRRPRQRRPAVADLPQRLGAERHRSGVSVRTSALTHRTPTGNRIRNASNSVGPRMTLGGQDLASIEVMDGALEDAVPRAFTDPCSSAQEGAISTC